MWTEILKDFGTAFLLAWLLWPITSTILSAPLDIAYRLSRSKDSMAVRRGLRLLLVLLALLFGLLAHASLDWYAEHGWRGLLELFPSLNEPLNPPLELNLGNNI